MMVTAAIVLSCVLHSLLPLAGWAFSAVCGIVMAAACGGPVILLVGMMMSSGGYSRLCRLSIPRGAGDLELDTRDEIAPEKADAAEGLKCGFASETERHQLAIPRDLVAAVQLCPWKYTLATTHSGRQYTLAVQGLLVLASPDAEYERVPILLTGDLVGAARLMEKLARTLHVLSFLAPTPKDGKRKRYVQRNVLHNKRAGGKCEHGNQDDGRRRWFAATSFPSPPALFIGLPDLAAVQFDGGQPTLAVAPGVDALQVAEIQYLATFLRRMAPPRPSCPSCADRAGAF